MLPLLSAADEQLDRRLVVTLLVNGAAMIMLRNSSRARLLTELAAYIASPQHAPAGTKRLADLIHSAKWSAQIIHAFLWCHADQRLLELEQAAEAAYLLWDESVIEKPESNKIAGLSPVRSSQGASLTRPRPGYYQPPKGKIIVAGIPWLMLLLVGPQGASRLAAMCWWSTRGEHKTSGREVTSNLLKDAARAGGSGSSMSSTVAMQAHPGWRNCSPRRCASSCAGTRTTACLMHRATCANRGRWRGVSVVSTTAKSGIAVHRCWRKAGLIFMAVKHPDYPNPLWLVVCRGVKGQPPWYLLTNYPVDDEQNAWQIVCGEGKSGAGGEPCARERACPARRQAQAGTPRR